MSKAKRSRGKLSPRRIAEHQRQVQALELRLKGRSLREIADELGFHDESSVHRSISGALARTAKEPADEVRLLELERLDKLLQRVEEVLEATPTECEHCGAASVAAHLKAIDTATKLMDRRSKYIGLDAPTRSEVRVEQFDEAALKKAALAELLADPEMRDAFRQQLAEMEN